MSISEYIYPARDGDIPVAKYISRIVSRDEQIKSGLAVWPVAGWKTKEKGLAAFSEYSAMVIYHGILFFDLFPHSYTDPWQPFIQVLRDVPDLHYQWFLSLCRVKNVDNILGTSAIF